VAVVPEGYGRITSLALDPIEKKPIARWRGGTTVLSLGSYGCNMRCPFCQNASIAQAGPNDVAWREITPREIVSEAVRLAERRCVGIAYTYNEPLVNWEFLRDTATRAHENGLVNVLVSNGMASAHVLAEVLPLAGAFVCVTPPNPRKLEAADLAEAIRAQAGDADVQIAVASSFAEGVEKARQIAGLGTICAFGSLYSISEIKQALAQ